MAQRAYLDERARKDGSVGYRVRWRLGGVGRFQTEIFEAKGKAERFLLDVEDVEVALAAGLGQGARSRRRRGPRRTGARYRVQVAALAVYFPIVEDIDDQAIAAWITAMQRAGKWPKTISNQPGLLFAVAAYAVMKQWRTTDPFADTELPDRRRAVHRHERGDRVGVPPAVRLRPPGLEGIHRGCGGHLRLDRRHVAGWAPGLHAVAGGSRRAAPAACSSGS